MALVNATPQMIENVRDIIEAHAPSFDVDRLIRTVEEPHIWCLVDTTRRIMGLVEYGEVTLTRVDGTKIGPAMALQVSLLLPTTITLAQGREVVDALMIAIRNRRPDLLDVPLGGYGPRARALAIRNGYNTSFEELLHGDYAVWSTPRQALAFRGL